MSHPGYTIQPNQASLASRLGDAACMSYSISMAHSSVSGHRVIAFTHTTNQTPSQVHYIRHCIYSYS
uniref:Uncharacterized protein n=1 Tax=Arundo donax TaxID=35708 RepID=A0A0A9AY79_ARUDO